MAAITSIDGSQKGQFVATGVTLTASDTISLNPSSKQLLVLTNSTAGALTATVVGATAGNADIPGYGPVSVAAGYAIAVPANSAKAVKLADISLYLQGAVSITGGTGLNCKLFDL